MPHSSDVQECGFCYIAGASDDAFRRRFAYLLARFGRWSPIVELVLFTLYHFWQPYYYVTRFFGMLPGVLVVWWKRSFKLGVVTHCAMYLVGGLLTMGLVLGQV